MIQSSTTLNQDNTWESNKNTINHHTQESQEVSPFPAGDHKATANRQETWQTRNTVTKMIHKRSTALERFSKNILLEGLN